MSMFGNEPKVKKEIVPEIGQQTQNKAEITIAPKWFFMSVSSKSVSS